jgi:hypothetical protein
MQMQQQQMAQQAQMQQQQAAQGQLQAPGQDPQAQGQDQQPQQPQQEPQDEGQDLDTAISQLAESISKSELTKSDDTPIGRKDLMRKHKSAKLKIMKEFEKQSKDMVDQILGVITGKKED